MLPNANLVEKWSSKEGVKNKREHPHTHTRQKNHKISKEGGPLQQRADAAEPTEVSCPCPCAISKGDFYRQVPYDCSYGLSYSAYTQGDRTGLAQRA